MNHLNSSGLKTEPRRVKVKENEPKKKSQVGSIKFNKQQEQQKCKSINKQKTRRIKRRFPYRMMRSDRVVYLRTAKHKEESPVLVTSVCYRWGLRVAGRVACWMCNRVVWEGRCFAVLLLLLLLILLLYKGKYMFPIGVVYVMYLFIFISLFAIICYIFCACVWFDFCCN